MRRILPLLGIVASSLAFAGEGSRFAVRFLGTGAGQQDRAKIPLASAPAANVGSNFTVELWIRATYADNAGTVSTGQNGDGWITGNVIIDRDVYGGGDYGDYGIALGRSGAALVAAFGAHNGTAGETIVGTHDLGDGVWHHLAATRTESSGLMRIFVDGALSASGTGPTGNLAYRVGRATMYPNSDPFLVVGAEKHDAGTEYPSFRGDADEFRIWNRALETGELADVAGRVIDPATVTGLVACWRFEEGTNTLVRDNASGATGTLTAGIYSNGQWISQTGGDITAPIAALPPSIRFVADDAVAWYGQQNFRYRLETPPTMPEYTWDFAGPSQTSFPGPEGAMTATWSRTPPVSFLRVSGEPSR